MPPTKKITEILTCWIKYTSISGLLTNTVINACLGSMKIRCRKKEASFQFDQSSWKYYVLLIIIQNFLLQQLLD